MGKPPPPVPPRPSKTLVAEALAKTRKAAPVRTAPPPPAPAPEVTRSKSTVNISVGEKAKSYERSISEEVKSTRTVIFQSPKIEKKDEDQVLNDRNHVNTLIDEMFASVLEVSTNDDDGGVEVPSVATVVVVEDHSSSNSSTVEKKKVQFDDRMNHELLISELESMRLEDEKIAKRQRKPDLISDSEKIQHSDWVEVNDGQEVRLSSCQITIDDLKNDKLNLDYERYKFFSYKNFTGNNLYCENILIKLLI